MIKNYLEEREVYKGDIIRWNDNYFIPDRNKLKKNYFIVKSDMPTNNGNFKAVNSDGSEMYFNTTKDNYTIVKRKER